jgi:hypothetical protein
MERSDTCTIYDWRGSPEFLLFRTLPRSRVLPATIGQPWRDLALQIDPECRFFFFHLNATFTGGFVKGRDQLVRELERRGIRCFNAAATNISKRFLHSTCLGLGLSHSLASPDGDPDELVIVKTDLNAGGDIEYRMPSEERVALGLDHPSEALIRLRETLLARRVGIRDIYPVLPRKSVLAEWWNDPQLVVERFIENREQRFCRIHFFLDRISVTHAICRATVKKLPYCDTSTHHYFQGTVPVSGCMPKELPAGLLTAARMVWKAMRLDFGAVDVVFDEDSHFFFVDMNHTPYGGTSESHAVYAHLRLALIDTAD